MTDKMEYSKGKWRVRLHPDSRIDIEATKENGVKNIVCNMVYEKPASQTDADAQLIVSAVNTCIDINPSNPMAVAEGMKDMAELIKAMAEATTDKRLYELQQNVAIPLLAKIEEK